MRKQNTRGAVSLLVVFFVCGISYAQEGRSSNSTSSKAKVQRAARHRPRTRSKTVRTRANASVVGSEFLAIARDGAGDIWVSGSLLLSKGLLVRARGAEIIATAFSEVQFIDDLTFPATDVGWMIAGGHLYKTGDGGLNWQRLDVGQDSEFLSLTFSDVLHGWASGRGGVIYHTDDGGSTWNKQESGTTLKLWKITFVDGLKGWAVGGETRGDLTWRSVLIATDDGGYSWKSLPNESDLTFHDLAFVDQTTGWGLDMRKKVIVHTDDGGRTWRTQIHLEQDSYHSIFFLDEQRGWVIGNPVLYTDDGGENWSIKTREDFAYFPKKAIFIDSMHGWAIGKTSKQIPHVLSTIDGGRTWQVISENWQSKLSLGFHQ